MIYIVVHVFCCKKCIIEYNGLILVVRNFGGCELSCIN